METQEPTPEEIAERHRRFAVEMNGIAWDHAERPERTAAEIEEMIHAAHAAAIHWSSIGTELTRARADMLLGQAYAQAGEGKQAMFYARRCQDYFAAHETKDWEIAFVHGVLANAARAAGDEALYAEHYAMATKLREVIADSEDREIFDRTYNLIRPGVVSPMIGDADFLEQFETYAWPLEDWHHRQHIKVAYLYLSRYPFETAMSRIRERIKAYNLAHNIPDLPTSGYHETMTQAWMRLVNSTIRQFGPAESADVFFERSPQLSEKKILRLFYSADVFMSPRAKFEFLESDLIPLPKP
jgi:hypothetical protein